MVHGTFLSKDISLFLSPKENPHHTQEPTIGTRQSHMLTESPIGKTHLLRVSTAKKHRCTEPVLIGVYYTHWNL